MGWGGGRGGGGFRRGPVEALAQNDHAVVELAYVGPQGCRLQCAGKAGRAVEKRKRKTLVEWRNTAGKNRTCARSACLYRGRGVHDGMRYPRGVSPPLPPTPQKNRQKKKTVHAHEQVTRQRRRRRGLEPTLHTSCSSCRRRLVRSFSWASKRSTCLSFSRSRCSNALRRRHDNGRRKERRTKTGTLFLLDKKLRNGSGVHRFDEGQTNKKAPCTTTIDNNATVRRDRIATPLT